MGVARIKILRLVLEATIKGACRPPRQSDLRAHGTTERYNRKLWIAGLFEGAAYLPA